MALLCGQKHERTVRWARGVLLTDNTLATHAAYAVDVRDCGAVPTAAHATLAEGRVVVDAATARLEVVLRVDTLVHAAVTGAEGEAVDGAALEAVEAAVLGGRLDLLRTLLRGAGRRGSAGGR